MGRIPELMDEREARSLLPSASGPRSGIVARRELVGGTVYDAEDVRQLVRWLRDTQAPPPSGHPLPDLMSTTMAARHLGVRVSNLGRLWGIGEVERQRVGGRWIYLADDVRELKRRRDAGEARRPKPPTPCPRHGEEDMRERGRRRVCAICERERVRAYRAAKRVSAANP